MRKIFLLLFILVSFQAFAFDVENLNGASCTKVSDASEDGFDPAFWYDYECSFNDSLTLQDVYKDVIQNIADESSKMLSDASDFSQSEFNKKVNEFKNHKKDFSYRKSYEGNGFDIGVQFTNNQITIATNEGQGEEYYKYTINKSGNGISLTFSYDSGF